MTRLRTSRARALPAPRPTWQAALGLAALLSTLWLLALGIVRGGADMF